MAEILEAFHNEILQDIHGSADAEGRYLEDAFFERLCNELVEAGELETADRAPFASPRGLRVDGYGGDPTASAGVLSLIVCDFNQSPTVITLTATDMEAIFKRVSIVDAERAVELVPKISEFANSQNRVNAADFFANTPYHIQMEKFSRRIFAPSKDGTFRESKWFYERARGQFHDARALRGPAEQRKFDLEFPKRQVISKTDLAKFLNVWECHPDIVSKGAQKNFALFANAVGKEWTKNADRFNERYYRHAIAKAIVFQKTEELVTEQSWYQGGYRANVVAYAISKLAHDVKELNYAVDFDLIWKAQDISSAMSEALVIVSEAVHEVLTTPPSGMSSNVTEWAKQQACWSRVQALTVEWPKGFRREWLNAEEQKQGEKEAVRSQQMLNGIEAQTAVVTAGGAFWRSVWEWGMEKRALTPKEAGILEAASRMSTRQVPSEAQCQIAMEALQKLRSEGCQIGMEII